MPDDPRPSDTLDRHRAEIEDVDRGILELVVRRCQIVQEIGRLKSNARIPLRNFEVEARVTRRLRALCEELGMDSSLGEDLSLFLIRKAIELQAPIVDTVYDGDRIKVLVVGGLGGMGQWISRFLNDQGHQVRIHDPSSGSTFLPRSEDLAESAAWADLTVVAVPVSACEAVLEELATHRPRGVVAEMCSVKSHLVPLFADLRRRGLRLVSFHPMFGPGVRVLSGKRIVICRAGHSEDEEFVGDLFRNTSVNITEIELEEHDRLMAPVLGMAHLLSIGFAGAMIRFGLPFPRLQEVASVTFLKQVATTEEVVSENPRLYYEIQAKNDSTGDILQCLIEALQHIRRAVDQGDAGEFASIMERGRDYFEGPRPS